MRTKKPHRADNETLAEGSEFMGLGSVSTIDAKSPGRWVVVQGFRVGGYVKPKAIKRKVKKRG